MTYSKIIRKDKYPRFFNVDGVLITVRLDEATNEIYGKTVSGADYPPLKAYNEGEEISEETYRSLS